MSRQIDKVQISESVEIQTNKNVANGYAGLDASGKIISTQITSTLQSVTDNGATTTNAITINNTLTVNSSLVNKVAQFESTDTIAQIYLLDNSTTEGEALRRTGDNLALYANTVQGINVTSTAVNLNYAGATKLATTNTGVSVTGNEVVSGTVSEAGTLLSAKYLGITATATDSNLLDGIDSLSFVRSDAVTSGYIWIQRSSTSSALNVTQQSTGRIQEWYQGGTNGTVKSYVANNGDIYAPDFVATSDRRIKENIKDLDSYLDTVLKIADIVRVYDRIDTNTKDEIGFVAQELQEIVPQFVNEETDSYLGVKYNKMVVPLYKAIKEQQQIIDAQEQRLRKLEYDLQRLEQLLK